jgi:predicted DNA-binding transcriptional regulator AlpA
MAAFFTSRHSGEPEKNTLAENNERLLSPKDFGARVGLGSATIRNMVKEGKLKALRLNARVIRLSESELSRLKMLAL